MPKIVQLPLALSLLRAKICTHHDVPLRVKLERKLMQSYRMYSKGQRSLSWMKEVVFEIKEKLRS